MEIVSEPTQSAMGHSRRFGCAPATSGLLPDSGHVPERRVSSVRAKCELPFWLQGAPICPIATPRQSLANAIAWGQSRVDYLIIR